MEMIPKNNNFCKLIVTFDAIEAQNNEKHHSTVPLSNTIHWRPWEGKRGTKNKSVPFLKMKKANIEIGKCLFCVWKRLILPKKMVPFTKRIWYHFPWQYGTILPINMVPFSISIWYHFLLGFRPYWKSRRIICFFKTTLFHFENATIRISNSTLPHFSSHQSPSFILPFFLKKYSLPYQMRGESQKKWNRLQ